MPGIVGLVTSLERERAVAQLKRMVESMRHEPFYSTGTWIDESLGVYIGWVEREPSIASAMPLRNETGERFLVFSGDEFPEPGTAQRLKERGHTLNGEDQSYLVHLSEEDAAFPAGLNGQFHGMLADRRAGTVMLFNDRYGLRRLYCHEGKDAFYFAAEAKAILAVRPELRNLDPRGLGEFISIGCVLEDRTLFNGIEVLPFASAWRFRAGALERRGKYFSPEEWENQSLLEPEPYYREVREIFSRNLPRYFAGPGKAGLSLTGGLDTRMMLAWLKPEPRSLPCYTFGGSYRENRDVLIARKVAQLCGLSHEVISVGTDFLARFPYYAERAVYLTDGCAGVNQAANIFVNEQARRIAPVRMGTRCCAA
jgi:asparagine synthase (glutamine-hydrolysing)